MKMLSLSGLPRTGSPAFAIAAVRKCRPLLTMLLLLLCQWLSAQQPVTVNPILPPPYSPYLESYLDKAVVLLTNNTQQVVQLKLIGNIESDEGIFVRTAEGWQPGAPIVLQPKQTKRFFANSKSENFLDPQHVETNIGESQQADIARTGILPEGNYTFCVKAVDYTSGAPLSATEPQGCIPITISYPEPPNLTFPTCGADLSMLLPTFAWTPPIGNLNGAALRYDFYLLKLLPGQDPNDAMQLAVQYNAGNPLKITNLQTTSYNYKPYDPPLVHHAEYAWQVVARDQNNKIVFQNGGKSEVCTFIWKKPGKVLGGDPIDLVGNTNNAEDDNDAPVDPPAGTCAGECAFDLSNPGMPWPNPIVGVDTIIKMGTFNLKIISLDSPNPLHPGTISGSGLIPIPFINSDRIRVRVHFDSVMLNTDLQVIAGSAEAKVHPGAESLIPEYDDNGWDGFSLGNAGLFGMKDWIEGQIDSAKQNLLSAYNTYGFEMPLGYGMSGHSLAITQMRWRPTYAQFDALAIVNLPNFTGVVTPLALGIGNLCFSSESLCQEGKLFLAQPFGVDLMSQPGKELTLLPSSADPANLEGTYLTFDTSGIKIFHLEADYALPNDAVTRADGAPGPVIAHFEATMDSLTDWLFAGLIDDFYPAGSTDFRFHADTVWVDLSDASNPPAPNMDAIYIPLYSDPTWTGLFCKQIAVQFKNPLNNSPNPTQLTASNLFIDSSGVSVHLLAENLIDYTTGQVESFNFSLDTLDVAIQHNSFVYAKMSGAMLFNVAGRNWDGNFIKVDARSKQNSIVYHCLLTHIDPDPNDGKDEKKLQYEFAMQPKDSVEVPIWYFTLGLDPTSHVLINNTNGSFYAECMLNGTFGINVSIPAVGETDFVGIHYQNLGLSSKAPYFNTDNFNISLASPQHTLADFPLNINDIEFVTDTHSHFGVRFDIGLKLSEMNAMLPDASSKFTIYGSIFDASGKVNPSFAHADLNEICIDANLSVVHVKGCVTLFNDDATFGNGFRGNLLVSLPSMADITATLQIGRVNQYDYWYFDALVMLQGTGIPMFAGLEAFGFGGGAYYHMARQQDTLIYAFDPAANVELDTSGATQPPPGFTSSGIQYLPDQSVDLGIKALIYFGSMGQRDVFNGDVGLEITIENGGLGKIRLDGNARFISDEDMKKGTVTGFLHALYDHPNKVFSLNAGANLDAGIVTASAVLALYIDGKLNPTGFFIKFGRPLPNEFANITFMQVYSIETYFEVGNLDIDPMPGPPAFIANMPGVQNYMANASQRFQPNLMPGQFAIIHGGRSVIDFSGSFLAFYASLQAGYGYDMQLTQVTQGCGGQSASETGFDGWYANGQIYIGFKGEIGIEIDLDFVSGRFSILELGMAALMEGGFANPTWLSGVFTGDYSVLDGLVTGHFEYPFEVGEKCVIPDPDPLEKIKLITDIYPQDGVKTTDVTVTPAAATILKMDPSQQIYMTQKMKDGTIKHRLFKFSPDLLTAKLTKNGATEPLEAALISDDRYGLSWKPAVTLDKTTDYVLTITAQLKSCESVSYDEVSHYASCNGSWIIAQHDGVDWKEEHIVKFKTNDGLDSIKESMVQYTFPYNRSRAFLWKDKGTPGIQLVQGFNPASYKLGPAGANLTFKSKFIPLCGNGNPVIKNISLNKGDVVVKMDWPAQLQTSTYYSVQLLCKWDLPQQNGNGQNAVNNPNNGGNFTSQVVDKVYLHDNYKFATVYRTKLAADKLLIPANTVKLYEYRFRTSQYPNLQAKLDEMAVGSACYEIKKSAQQYKDVTISGKDLDTPESIVAAINKKMGYAPGSIPTIRFMPFIRMRGEEKFDVYDINGFEKPGQAKIPPFAQYTKNSAFTDFHMDLLQELQKTLQTKGLASPDLAGLLDRFNFYMEAPTDGLIAWDEGLTAGCGNNAVAGNQSDGFSGFGGNFILYKPGGSKLELNDNRYQFDHDWIQGENGGISANPNLQYDGKKWVLKYIAAYAGRWQPPAQIDPFEWIGDLVEIWEWKPEIAGFSYGEYLERLGIAYDIANTHWVQLGNINPVNPVIRTPGGTVTAPISGGILNPVRRMKAVGGK